MLPLPVTDEGSKDVEMFLWPTHRKELYKMVSWIWLVVGMFFAGCFGFTIGMIWDKKDWKQYQKLEMERERKREALQNGDWH